MLLLSSSLAASILGKATVIATLGLLGAWLTRRSRAAVRHSVLAASFAVLLALPIASTLIKPFRIALSASTREWEPLSLFPAPMDATQPATAVDGSVVVASATPRSSGLSPSDVLLAVWIAGAAFFLLRMILGLQQVRALRRFGLPWRDGQSVANRLALDSGIYRRVEVLLHESLPAPVTCGIVRPAIVLPPDAQGWEGEDLNRAIVHELEHVRRFDWASHCLARIACAVYWFHPLVWAAWRHLALEAERSCDDAVLARSEATAYADQLVGLARRLSAAQTPALAMASRSDLSARVGAVLDSRRARGRAGALLVAVACAVAAAVVLTVSPLRMVAAPQSVAPAAVQNIPKWDAVSIKRCTSPPVLRAEGQGAGAPQSPDRITANCATLERLVEGAYIFWAGGHLNMLEGFTTPHEGFPGWTSSERYTIEAKAQGSPGQTMMWGPMMQALLADRFHLKVHKETREGRVYILSAAKGGIKMQALQPGTCESRDYVFSKDRPPGRANPPANPCPFQNNAHHGPNWAFDDWLSMDSLATFLTGLTQGPDSLGAPILNKTGLTGAYHVQLQWSDSNAPADASSYPSIFTAAQKLGLTLEAGKGPRQFLVFDHAERPTEN
jgi:uncharacterized protein (TIGR03435 family)